MKTTWALTMASFKVVVGAFGFQYKTGSNEFRYEVT